MTYSRHLKVRKTPRGMPPKLARLHDRGVKHALTGKTGANPRWSALQADAYWRGWHSVTGGLSHAA